MTHPATETPAITPRKKTAYVIAEILTDQMFGYDFFIAYTRRDGALYASALADELRGRGFRCFLDKSDFGAGDPLSGATYRALKKTNTLILIGSPRVHESEYVQVEVDLSNKLSRKIIPIDIGKTLENSKSACELRTLLSDRIRIDEEVDSLGIGPSKEVVGNLLQSFKSTRQETKRIRILGITALVFAIVAMGAVFFAWQANAATKTAEERRNEAVKQTRIANEQRKIAEDRQLEAERQTQIAQDEKRKADEQREIANSQRKEAESARARAVRQTQIAQRERKNAESNLARAYYEKGMQARADQDLFSAKVLFAKSLTLKDTRDSRKELIESWHTGANWRWTSSQSSDQAASSANYSANSTGKSAVVFSPNGRQVISSDLHGNITIAEALDGKTIRKLDHNSPVRALAINNDGLLASGGEDGKVKLWDTNTGIMTKEMDVSNPVRGLAFQPNGQLLAVGTSNDGLKVLNYSTGKEAWGLSAHEMTTQGVTFSPDGDLLYWGSSDNWVRVSTSDGESTQNLIKSEGWTYSISCSPNSRFIAIADASRKIILIDLAQKRVAELIGHRSDVFSVAFSYDSKYLVSGGNDRTVRVWDVLSVGQRIMLPIHPNEVYGVAFAPTSYLLTSASLDGKVRVYEIASELNNAIQGPPSQLEETIKQWKKEHPETPHPLEGALQTGRYSNWIVSLKFTENQRLISASKDGPIKIWNPRTFESVGEIETRPGLFGSSSIDIGSAEKLLVTIPDLLGRQIEIWSLDNSTKIKEIPVGNSKPRCLSLRKDGRQLAISFDDGTIQLISLFGNWNPIILKGEKYPVLRIDYSDNGKLLAVGYESGTIIIWDLENKRIWRTLTGHQEGVEAITFFDNDKQLATASADQTVRLWQLETSRCFRILNIWAYEITKSQNGRWLATGGYDQFVRLLSTKDGLEWAALRGHSGAVHALAFSPDTHLLASSGEDSTIRLWDMELFERLADGTPSVILNEAEQGGGLHLEGFQLLLSPKKK